MSILGLKGFITQLRLESSGITKTEHFFANIFCSHLATVAKVRRTGLLINKDCLLNSFAAVLVELQSYSTMMLKRYLGIHYTVINAIINQ